MAVATTFSLLEELGDYFFPRLMGDFTGFDSERAKGIENKTNYYSSVTGKTTFYYLWYLQINQK